MCMNCINTEVIICFCVLLGKITELQDILHLGANKHIPRLDILLLIICEMLWSEQIYHTVWTYMLHSVNIISENTSIYNELG